MDRTIGSGGDFLIPIAYSTTKVLRLICYTGGNSGYQDKPYLVRVNNSINYHTHLSKDYIKTDAGSSLYVAYFTIGF